MSKFALLFLAVFLGGIMVALFYNGAAAFILYQLVYFLNPSDRWWSAGIPGISYSFVTSILMLAVLAMGYRKLSEQSPWSEHPSLKWLVAILLSYYAAHLWALAPASHDKFTFAFLKVVIVIFTAYKLLNTKMALTASIWAYLIGCTYVGYLGTITGRNSGDRLEGIALPETDDVNPVAAAIVPAGVLLLYYAWMGNTKVRILCFFCGALIANGLVLFNSRGAFLGTIASTGLYLLHMMFSRHRQRGQRAMALVIVVLGISGGLYITDDTFWSRMETLSSNTETNEGGAGRITFWFAAVEMMGERPLGMGVNGFNLLAPIYLTEEERGGETYRAVHSLWFQGLTEVGWHGFFFFLAMLFTLYRLSRRARMALLKEGNYSDYFKLLALECALFGYLVCGTFINQFRAEILYWMLLLVAVGTKVHYLQPVREKTAGSKAKASRQFAGQGKRA